MGYPVATENELRYGDIVSLQQAYPSAKQQKQLIMSISFCLDFLIFSFPWRGLGGGGDSFCLTIKRPCDVRSIERLKEVFVRLVGGFRRERHKKRVMQGLGICA